jgi:hypothetical protein
MSNAVKTQAFIRKAKKIDTIRRTYAKGVPTGKGGRRKIMDDISFIVSEIDEMQIAILLAVEHLKAAIMPPKTEDSGIRHALASLNPFRP